MSDPTLEIRKDPVWESAKILRGLGNHKDFAWPRAVAQTSRQAHLTQIKVILSARAEIRPGRCKFGQVEVLTKMHSYFAPAIAIAMTMPAILSARSVTYQLWM
jgi:hypothetical protein